MKLLLCSLLPQLLHVLQCSNYKIEENRKSLGHYQVPEGFMVRGPSAHKLSATYVQEEWASVTFIVHSLFSRTPFLSSFSGKLRPPQNKNEWAVKDRVVMGPCTLVALPRQKFYNRQSDVSQICGLFL